MEILKLKDKVAKIKYPLVGTKRKLDPEDEWELE